MGKYYTSSEDSFSSRLSHSIKRHEILQKTRVLIPQPIILNWNYDKNTPTFLRRQQVGEPRRINQATTWRIGTERHSAYSSTVLEDYTGPIIGLIHGRERATLERIAAPQPSSRCKDTRNRLTEREGGRRDWHSGTAGGKFKSRS